MSDHERTSDGAVATAPRRRVATPWWYYFALADFAAAAVIVALLAPGIPASLALLALIIANALLEALRRRISGEPPPAFRSRALPYTVSGIVLVLGALALGWYLVLSLGLTEAAWLIGAVIFTIIFLSGWLGDRAALAGRR